MLLWTCELKHPLQRSTLTDANLSRIGEISLMKDLTKTMDITMEEIVEDTSLNDDPGVAGEPPRKGRVDEGSTPQSASESIASPSPATPEPFPAPAEKSTATPPPRKAIEGIPDESSYLDAAGISPDERELRKKEKKKGGLTPEQRKKLAEFEKERREIRDKRVDTLAQKLIDRISILTEMNDGPESTRAFKEKMKLEVENLKMESFGLEILHAVGTTYVQKATSFLKSQKFLGISGFFSRLKDKGTLAKETWNTISSALDAQMTIEEMAKLEEKGGEDWTDERKVEYERRVTGKILAAAWRGSKFEIQGVLRDVCDKVLNDKTVPLQKRIERAHALVICGTIFEQVSPITTHIARALQIPTGLMFC
jgi:X-domain of DnaJ-containing